MSACRRPAGYKAVSEVKGDGEEVCQRGLRLLQLQRAPIVSFSVHKEKVTLCDWVFTKQRGTFTNSLFSVFMLFLHKSIS